MRTIRSALTAGVAALLPAVSLRRLGPGTALPLATGWYYSAECCPLPTAYSGVAPGSAGYPVRTLLEKTTIKLQSKIVNYIPNHIALNYCTFPAPLTFGTVRIVPKIL